MNSLSAASYFTLEPESFDAGRWAGQAVLKGLGPAPVRAVLAFATMDHDHPALLRGLAQTLGPGVQIVGCTSQGVVANGDLTENGFALGVMGFAGEALGCASVLEREVQEDSQAKGRALAMSLKRKVGGEPTVAVLLYDPLCGLDVEVFLKGVRQELACPLVGGGASQPWGPRIGTSLFAGTEVFSHGAILLGLSGPFQVDIGNTHGCVPVGYPTTITRADGNRILEIGGKPAVELMREITGEEPRDIIDETVSAFCIAEDCVSSGLCCPGRAEDGAVVIRSVFGVDTKTGAVLMQAAIPEGTPVTFYRQSTELLMSRPVAVAQEMARRCVGQRPWAILGFECGASTFHFLGPSDTLRQHERLRAILGEQIPWLGMMAWGEVSSFAGAAYLHQCTYPIAVLKQPHQSTV
jgi:hypothetical protein